MACQPLTMPFLFLLKSNVPNHVTAPPLTLLRVLDTLLDEMEHHMRQNKDAH